MIYVGGCHCGGGMFRSGSAGKIKCGDHKCSICSRLEFLHLGTPKSHFNLLNGREDITAYTFDTSVAHHYFCTTCGVKSLYIPRSKPDGYDVNVRCLEPEPAERTIEPFDIKSWEQHAYALPDFSKETATI